MGPSADRPSPLLDCLAAWRPFRAIVVGDVMLDELVYGNADRLSADAPVPILHVQRSESRPGGAANVCLDLAAMRGDVAIIAVVGGDDAGRELRRSLDAAGIRTHAIAVDGSRPTTRKRSLIGLAQHRHPQKMFREDHESREPLSREIAGALLAGFERELATADLVCIEDYAKGVCTPEICRAVIDRARARGVPVFVDPARIEDYSKYRGAAAITPNRTEAELATGLPTGPDADAQARDAANARLARALAGIVDAEAVVLTLDRHGAMLLERAGEPQPIPTAARDVYDVTGAGDMFLAGLAAARANGLAWPDAARLANAAAGLEVEVFGVEPMPIERIHHEVLRLAGAFHGKARTLDQIRVEVAVRRSRGQRIVFTNGCFDVIHAGHISLLDRAAKEGDFLIVGLNDDASVRGLKGEGRPINRAEDRLRVLGALQSVGAVVVFGDPTPIRLIEAIAPDVLVKGADYTRERVVGAAFVESRGGRVVLADLVDGKSTTATIASLKRV